jgi:3-dehydroquinate dehydratase-1
VRQPKICGSIANENLELIHNSEQFVDYFELRLDLVGLEWDKIANSLKKPWIACNRSQKDGGKGDLNNTKRVDKLLKAADHGAAILDIELSTENLMEYVPALKTKAWCLISYHDYFATPSYDSLVNVLGDELNAGADICKIVTTANSLEDNVTMLKLINNYPNIKLIAFTMGETGRISRILSPLAGGYFTYGCLEEGLETASGQISVKELHQIYKILNSGGNRC